MNVRSFMWRAAYLLAALGIYLSDQASKAWAVRVLRQAADKVVLSGYLTLSYAENTGIAFSLFQEGGDLGRWFLIALAVIATVSVLIFFWRTSHTDDSTLGALALLLAGITGNLTDRIRQGYVVDFIDVHWGAYHWPTFNIADVSICMGAALLAIKLLLASNPSPQLASQAPNEQRTESIKSPKSGV